ncbi:MlaE family ABC transporter permease [Massilia glaciei]|uniref:ABC transporter permease n=1 Tax=Massilia glaciei TaxID=1524097 RepID=A0A2U2HE28_9BURK|nr:ABC transporter permease [Massilia glaciei]PWF41570.1 ABC transporter permease [Massilia glaciei]
MRRKSYLHTTPSRWGPLLVATASSWWYMLHLGAISLVMAFSPTTYNKENRRATSRHLYIGLWQVLPWFTMLSALVSLVLIRIVVVSALSYGLSRYALEMVVRVLVLELIPLSAAMFVALRAGLAFNPRDALAVAVATADSKEAAARAQNRLRRELVPQVISSAFSVLALAMVSSIMVLVLAYLVVYGFSPWGLGDYTRTVGRVFDPLVTIGFGLKTVMFGLAVAVIPSAAMLEIQRRGRAPSTSVQPGAMRLLFVLFSIEAASLAVKYI